MQELEAIFPTGSNMPSLLIQEMGEAEAFRIARRAARKMTNLSHREKYVLASILNPRKIAAKQEWLDRHPPFEDILDLDEQRAMPLAEIRERNREIGKCEAEVDALAGSGPGFDILLDAVGRQRATAMYLKLMETFAANEITDTIAGRINTIMLKASTATWPERYVDECIKNERVRLAKQESAGSKTPMRASKARRS
jgi:hypothetical protein